MDLTWLLQWIGTLLLLVALLLLVPVLFMGMITVQFRLTKPKDPVPLHRPGFEFYHRDAMEASGERPAGKGA